MSAFCIVFLPIIYLADHAPGTRSSPAGITCHSVGTTIGRYRSGFATMALFAPILHGVSAVGFRLCFEVVARNMKSSKATIYHNPMCGTSRKTLEILRDSGRDVWVREYLKTPPTRDELKRLYDKAGISPREGLRAKEPLAAELGLIRDDVTDDEVLDAMLEHPILINRPLVETEKGVRLCRPQDLVRDIL
jgi:arsenate reductase